MLLREYLKEEGITITAFARKLGVSKANINNIFRGVEPRLATAVKIQELTRGRVQCKDLLSVKKSPNNPAKEKGKDD